MFRAVARLLPMLWVGCATQGALKGDYFVKGPVRYRVAALDPAHWQPKAFRGNDLAWVHRKSGRVLALNCTCSEHGDPPLEALMNHLLGGFTEREKLNERREPLDGREALSTEYRAKLDGVALDLQLAVTKKNGCVYDFSSLVPIEQSQEGREGFEQLLAAFTTEGGP